MADEAARHRGLVDLVGLMGVRRVAHGALGHALPEMHLVRVEELWNQPVLERLVEVLVAVRAREERLARDLDRRERTGESAGSVRAARTQAIATAASARPTVTSGTSTITTTGIGAWTCASPSRPSSPLKAQEVGGERPELASES
jgi:hypothetical protein